MQGRVFETSGSVPIAVVLGKPTPIDNECFEGSVVYHIHDTPSRLARGQKLADVPPFWETIVQGRFKGEYENFFMGIELNLPLKLGMISRGIAMSLVRFVKTMEADVHTSAGDRAHNECPHIVTQHFKGVDYLIITPNGETPPSIEESLLGSTK